MAALGPLLEKRFWDEVKIPALASRLFGFPALLLLQLVWLDIPYPELSLLGSLYVVRAAWLIWLGRVLATSCGMEQPALPRSPRRTAQPGKTGLRSELWRARAREDGCSE